MSKVIGNITYTTLEDIVDLNAPYDGSDIISDRKSGWLVRSPMLDNWITGVPDRQLAERIKDALYKVAERATACAQDLRP